MDEAELVARMKRHDANAATEVLPELISRYEGSLTYMARGLLHDRRDVEEAVSDTFVKAFLHADSYRADGCVGAWLKMICHNTCVTRNRRKRLHLVAYDEVAAGDERFLNGGQGHEQEACEARLELERALMKLPEVQREAVVLVGMAGLTFEEAGRAAGVAATTLSYRYHAGLRRLAELMAETKPRGSDGA